ncbi:urocanase, partial [Kipferlia bialata]
VFVTSGLGGMSGAQAKAAVICGAVGVIAEVDKTALEKRHAQGWVMEVFSDLDLLMERVKRAQEEKTPVSIAYHGNVVDLWERFATSEAGLVDLGSDQTSLHNAFNGGYWPVGYTQEESRRMMVEEPEAFRVAVQESLVRHVKAINTVIKEKGMSRFFDYGNAFLLEAGRAGADVFDTSSRTLEDAVARGKYKYPSYVQDVMGDIFSLGFGPFRWVCSSGEHEDLVLTDKLASEAISECMADSGCPEPTVNQYADNKKWIDQAEENKLVVGSQARILYSDAIGRIAIAERFHEAIKAGTLHGPVVLSRDHHDVSGTDSPFRETSNIQDGSMFCADMAVQNCIGDASRGATWVALHNGGGVGFGEVMNGGFGHVLDGSEDSIEKARKMLWWDVCNGVTRRAWARNDNALTTIDRAMKVWNYVYIVESLNM